MLHAWSLGMASMGHLEALLGIALSRSSRLSWQCGASLQL